MTAGSKPIFLASKGSVQPINLAAATVTTSVSDTTSATWAPTRSSSRSLAKFTTARLRPQSTATRISFHKTAKISLKWISLRERPRIMVTEDWLPEFPPVSMSMGI